MKIRRFSCYLILFTALALQSKGQSVIFENAVPSSGTEVGYTVLETPDNSLIVVGSTTMNTAGLADIMVTKLTPEGTEIWTVLHGGFNNDLPYSAIMLDDGSFVIVGTTGSFTTTQSRDVYLLKMDAEGDILWTKSFGGSDTDEGTDVKETPEGDLIISAFTESYGAGDRDGWLLKTDSEGNLLWSQTYGGAALDATWAVDISPDGGYILAGGTYSFASGSESDLWLVKTDTAGNELWNQSYGVANFSDWGRDVAASPDGYVAVGLRNNDPDAPPPVTGEAHFLKVDFDGNLIWDNSIAGTYRNEGYSIFPEQNGGWLISGTKVMSPTHSSFWVAKANADGDILWNVNLGQSNSLNFALDVIQTNNGDVVATGFSGYTPSSEQDLHVLRLSDQTLAISENPDEARITAFPNPTTGLVRIDLGDNNWDGTVLVFNNTGALMQSQKIRQEKFIEFDLSYLSAGFYLIKVITPKEVASTKILKY